MIEVEFNHDVECCTFQNGKKWTERISIAIAIKNTFETKYIWSYWRCLKRMNVFNLNSFRNLTVVDAKSFERQTRSKQKIQNQKFLKQIKVFKFKKLPRFTICWYDSVFKYMMFESIKSFGWKYFALYKLLMRESFEKWKRFKAKKFVYSRTWSKRSKLKRIYLKRI